MKVDYLVVGAGLTGSTIARVLSDAGREVMVLERRSHVGGNVYDHVHPSGIRIHTYGPHYFRTDSDEIWDFVNRFASFVPYEPCLKSDVNGKLENWPIARSCIERLAGKDWHPEFRDTPQNFEEACLAMMPRVIYESFIKGYTEKQWGTPTTSIMASVARRFDVRLDDDPRLMRHRYQGIPQNGYAALMNNMLAEIPVVLNFDYLTHRGAFSARKLLIFTGPIDHFFDCCLGRLHYRGQERSEQYVRDVEFLQPCGQVNNPSPCNGNHIRTLEWKHMMPPQFAASIRGSVLTRETTITPEDPDQLEYPFPDHKNADLYRRYEQLTTALPGTMICGRLGEYRYLDMDHAIANAMNRILPHLGQSRQISAG